MHARRRILLAVRDRLTGLATTGTSVHVGRERPKSAAAAPFLLIYGRREQSAPLTIGGRNRKLERELLLRVEAVTSETDDDGAIADQVCAEVEAAMANDPTLGGVAKDLWLAMTDLDASAQGERVVGRAWIDFTVSYHTVATAPEQAV